MSLINKMLKDLESRQGSSRKERVAKPIYEDLRPSMGRERRGFGSPFIWLIVLVCVLAIGLWAWERKAQPTTSSPVAATTPAPVAVPEVLPEPPAAPEPTPPTPVVVEKPAAPTPKPVSKPVIAQLQVKPPVSKPKAALPQAASKQPAKAPLIQDESDSLEALPEGDGHFEKKEIPLTPEQQAENAYREAARYMQERRTAEAQAALETALKNNPAHAKARELLAGLHLQTGRTPEARQVLEEGLAKTPGNVSLAQLLARIYLDQGAEPKALSVMESVQSIAQKDAEFLALLATLYQRAGRHNDAIKAYRQALTLRPMEGKWWLALGISLEAQTDWFAAREAYTRARNSNLDARLAQYAEQRLQVIKNK